MWPAIAAAGIGAAASLLGGMQQQRAARAEARRNRRFQERMRDTAWQAAVADMKAAGINPAVAYSKGPAAAPGGSMAAQADITAGAVGSAMQLVRIKKELQLLDQQTAAAAAQAQKTQSEKVFQDWQNLLWGKRAPSKEELARGEVGPILKGPLWREHEARANAGAHNVRILATDAKIAENLRALAGTPAGKYAAWLQYIMKSIGRR